MDESQVRLEIVKALIPIASRADITDPEQLVKKAAVLEKYVVNKVIPRAKRGNG